MLLTLYDCVTAGTDLLIDVLWLCFLAAAYNPYLCLLADRLYAGGGAADADLSLEPSHQMALKKQRPQTQQLSIG